MIINFPFYLLPVEGEVPLRSVVFTLIMNGIYTYLSDLYRVIPSGGLVDQVLCKIGDDLVWSTYTLTDEKVKINASSEAKYLSELIDTNTLEVYNNKVRLKGGTPNFLGLADTPNEYKNASGTIDHKNKLLKVSSDEKKIEFSENISDIPEGLIVMFAGTVNSIPDGWAICNGATKYNATNYTPNLTGYFIIGASETYPAPKLTIRADKKTYEWVPTSNTTGGNESITLSINQLPLHRHGPCTIDYTAAGSVSIGAGSASTLSITPSSYIKWGSTGGGTPFSILPPHYDLLFIMKSSVKNEIPDAPF